MIVKMYLDGRSEWKEPVKMLAWMTVNVGVILNYRIIVNRRKMSFMIFLAVMVEVSLRVCPLGFPESADARVGYLTGSAEISCWARG